MEEVTLEEIVVQGLTINVMYDDGGVEFGDQTNLDSYVNQLFFSQYLKDIFLKLIDTLGEDAVVGKTLVFDPDAIDGVIVRLI
jgi:hypothetical protein